VADDDAAFEARVGTVLRGKWTLERLLGVGGMAAVYAARHKIGRLDAIKILHPEVARSGDARARFEQEAHAVNRLRHPGAVEIRDLETTEDGAPFIVMELLDGEPLSEIAKRSGGLGADQVLRYADALLDVLAAAHAQGIIHRDIKPDNLFPRACARCRSRAPSGARGGEDADRGDAGDARLHAARADHREERPRRAGRPLRRRGDDVPAHRHPADPRRAMPCRPPI